MINPVFDEKYEIRLANKNDIDKIMSFIDKYWKKGHILARDRSFFEYEFLQDDGQVNFTIAIDKEKNTIEAINGFVKASHSKDNLCIWGSIWKSLENNMPRLGTELIWRRQVLTGCKYDLGIGINPNTALPIFRDKFNKNVGKMKHYYFLNNSIDYKIAEIKHKTKTISNSIYTNIIKFNNFNELKEKFNFDKYDNVPYKDSWYVEHRFFNHPIYKYDVYGIEDLDKQIDAIFVLRKQEALNHQVIRLVDYIGNQDLLKYTNTFFNGLLDNKTEYIDFYCFNFNEENILNAGFTLKEENDTNIIPNYFSPFVKENIDIYVSYVDENTIFTKADGDQDRPN